MKKIDIDNNEITDQDALKHKDFGKVMDKFSEIKKPFFKSPYFGGGVVVFAILIAYLMYNQNTNTSKEVLSNSSYSALYSSPIGEKIAFENIEGVVDAENSLTITASSGTRITIPIHTLVDSLGDLITGVVTFKYREFLDQKDIFLSGIPMNYDSADVVMNFESGGMFELLAYQNDQPVFIAPEKTVQVELASKEVGDNFNIYYYSPEESRWIYKKKDETGFNKADLLAVNEELEKNPEHMSIQALKEEKLLASTELKKLKKTKPIKPVIANKSMYSFTINVDYKDFPELISFKGLKFQVSNKEKNFKPEYAQETWDGVDVTHGVSRAEYNTCFTNQKRGELCFITNPVFTEGDIANAEVLYEKLLEDYKSKKNSLKKRNKEIRNEIAKRSNELNDQRRIELNKRAVNMGSVVENRITRIFQIANFGIWNSDCPQRLPTEIGRAHV